MHALIIEDEALVFLLFRDFLSETGFVTFDAATTETKAIEYALRQCPDIIIADYKLAQGTGLDAVNAICRKTPVPVIFVTATPHLLGKTPAGSVVLKKPTTEDQFRAAYETVMKSRPANGL